MLVLLTMFLGFPLVGRASAQTIGLKDDKEETVDVNLGPLSTLSAPPGRCPPIR